MRGSSDCRAGLEPSLVLVPTSRSCSRIQSLRRAILSLSCSSLVRTTSIARSGTPKLARHGTGWVAGTDRAAPDADSASNSSPVGNLLSEPFILDSRINLRGTTWGKGAYELTRAWRILPRGP